MNKHFLVALFSIALALSGSKLLAEDQAQDPGATAGDATAAPAPSESAPAADSSSSAPAASAPASTPAPDAAQAPQEPAKQPQQPAQAGGTEKKIVTQDLKGKIESIDVSAKTLVVDGKTFTFQDSGKVFFKRKQKSLSDLKAGDMVAITYRDRDGKLLVSRINK